MFVFASATSLAHTWAIGGKRTQDISSYLHRNIVYGFTGPVPASFDDISFDASSIYDIIRNCETAIQFTMDLDDLTGIEGTTRMTSSHLRTDIATKQPYLDPTYNKWSLSPKLIVPQQFWDDDRNGIPTNINSTWGGNTTNTYLGVAVKSTALIDYRLFAAYAGLQHFWNKYRSRDQLLKLNISDDPYNNPGYDHYSEWPLGGRYPYNWPIVMEYEEETTFDSFEYYKGWYTGTGFSSTTITIDRWDETTETWVDEQILTVNEGVEVQYQDLPVSITGKTFRLRFGDTGSSAMYYAWFRLLTSTPPTARPSTDITWGLVCGYKQTTARFQDYVNRSGYSVNSREFFTVAGQMPNPELDNMQAPMLLVDIGDTANPGTMTLTKARDVSPGDVPELLDFVLDFNDN